MNHPDLSEVFSILERERSALLTAQFSRLDTLVPRKIALLSKINFALVPRSDIQRLHAQLSRTQMLLRAATQGLAAAAKRLSEGEKVASELATYSSNGQLSAVDLRQSKFARRS